MATWKTYLYLGAFAIACVIGIIVQYKIKPVEEQANLEGNNSGLKDNLDISVNNGSISINSNSASKL